MTVEHMLQADAFLSYAKHLAHTPVWDAWDDFCASQHMSDDDRREVRRMVEAALRSRKP